MSLWRYEASARGPRAILALGAWWGLVVIGLLTIALNSWIAVALLAFSLPAIWEMLRGTTAWLEIDSSAIRWGSGRRAGVVNLAEIETIRLDTRLDFSLRMTLILANGKKVRLPYECIPRAKRLKDVLDAQSLPYVHHHFALLS